MEIEIIFKDASAPKRINADNVYSKGDFLCVRVKNMIFKYPIVNIFSVCHEHGFHWGSRAHIADMNEGDGKKKNKER